MKKHNNYELKENEFYSTPAWVTENLINFGNMKDIISDFNIWEPAAGNGAMVDVLKPHCKSLFASDIKPQREDIVEKDYLHEYKNDALDGWKEIYNFDFVITNPPFSLAEKFINQTLSNGVGGLFLLRNGFDLSKKRKYLLGHIFFKILLQKRIRLIEGSTTSPMYTLAWYCFIPQYSCDCSLMMNDKLLVKNNTHYVPTFYI